LIAGDSVKDDSVKIPDDGTKSDGNGTRIDTIGNVAGQQGDRNDTPKSDDDSTNDATNGDTTVVQIADNPNDAVVNQSDPNDAPKTQDDAKDDAKEKVPEDTMDALRSKFKRRFFRDASVADASAVSFCIPTTLTFGLALVLVFLL
jgi:hypothetical protein